MKTNTLLLNYLIRCTYVFCALIFMIPGIAFAQYCRGCLDTLNLAPDPFFLQDCIALPAGYKSDFAQCDSSLSGYPGYFFITEDAQNIWSGKNLHGKDYTWGHNSNFLAARVYADSVGRVWFKDSISLATDDTICFGSMTHSLSPEYNNAYYLIYEIFNAGGSLQQSDTFYIHPFFSWKPEFTTYTCNSSGYYTFAIKILTKNGEDAFLGLDNISIRRISTTSGNIPEIVSNTYTINDSTLHIKIGGVGVPAVLIWESAKNGVFHQGIDDSIDIGHDDQLEWRVSRLSGACKVAGGAITMMEPDTVTGGAGGGGGGGTGSDVFPSPGGLQNDACFDPLLVWNMQGCGLEYTTVSVSTKTIAYPAPNNNCGLNNINTPMILNVTGIDADCYRVDRARIYWYMYTANAAGTPLFPCLMQLPGGGINFGTGSANFTSTLHMQMPVGANIWLTTWVADVTVFVNANGNGNYTITGLPRGSLISGETIGVGMVIAYTDFNSTLWGQFGVNEIGYANSVNPTLFNVLNNCAVSTGEAFQMAAFLDNGNPTYTIANTALASPANDCLTTLNTNINIPLGISNYVFNQGINGPAGLYFQCSACGMTPAITMSGLSPLCVGDSLPLTATATDFTGNSVGGVTGLNTLWTGPNGLNSNLLNTWVNPVVMADNGDYIFTATVDPGNNSVNCPFATDTISIVVNPLPLFDLGPDSIICFNAASGPPVIILGDPNITVGGDTTVLWSTGATTSTIAVNISNDSCFWMTATNLVTGCTYTDTICIIINQSDSVNLTIQQNCASGCFWPTATVFSNNTASSYSFDFWGQAPTGGTDFSEIVVSPTTTGFTSTYWCYGTAYGVYTATVSVSYGAGCMIQDTATFYHYDYRSLAGLDTVYCPMPDSLMIGDPILSTFPLGPVGTGFTIHWTHLNTGQNFYNQANPFVTLIPGTTNIFVMYIMTPEGCDYRDTVYITTCCFKETGVSVFIIQPNTVVDNSTVPPAVTDIWIQGDITISGDVIWSTKKVRVAPGRKIVIPASILPDYHRLVLDETIIRADCDSMWQGIQIIGDTAGKESTVWPGLVVMNNSRIQDAVYAIHSILGGPFIVQKSRLDGNYTHILINDFSQYKGYSHPSYMDSANLRCSLPLLYPYSGDRTYFGVYLSIPTPVSTKFYHTDGGPTGGFYYPSVINGYHRNIIDNANIGIYANNINTWVNKCNFANIRCHSAFTNPCPIPIINELPTAIRFHGNGSELEVKNCNFNKCDNGINDIASSHTNIYYNTFNATSNRNIIVQSHPGANNIDIYGNDFTGGSIGIHAYWNQTPNLFVHDNIIRQCYKGVLLNLNTAGSIDIYDNDMSGGFIGVETFQNQQSNLDIHNNIITNTSLNGVMTRGISVTEPHVSTDVLVRQNTITAKHMGIFLNGTGSGMHNPRVRFNQVNMSTNILFALPTGGNPMSNFGIYFLGTSSARAVKNNIEGPALFTTSSTTWQNNMRGFCINNSLNSQIYCNSIKFARDGLQAASGNTNSQIRRNQYFSGRTAVYIEGGGYTGLQGNTGMSHDNEFHCPFTVSCLRSESGTGALSKHFVRNAPSAVFSPATCLFASTLTTSITPPPIWLYNLTYIAYSNSSNGYATFAGPGSDWCTGTNSRVSEEEEIPVPEIEQILFALDSVVWDSLVTDVARRNLVHWESDFQIYRTALQFDDLVMQSSRLDSFAQEMDSLNYGKIRRAWEFSAIGYYAEALSELESIDASDAIAGSYAYVYKYLIQMEQGVKWDSLDTEVQEDIAAIAQACPEHLGLSVHIARSLLSVNGVDIPLADCEIIEPESFDIDSTFSPDTLNTGCLLVYPNPADQYVNISLECEPESEFSLMIINNQGEILYEHTFEDHEPEIEVNTSEWIQGAYHVILYHQGIYRESKVLAIYR